MGANTASQLTSSEEAQLAQTIEMFEVITQSQPQDYQSLEILKEAYAKLGREQDVVNTSKRIAQAYVTMGQLSSAILEYESILQRYPEDADVLAALGEIESKANELRSRYRTFTQRLLRSHFCDVPLHADEAMNPGFGPAGDGMPGRRRR